MAMKIQALSDDDYRALGRRYGSDDVAKEAASALTRWNRDVAALTLYGQGPRQLEELRAAAIAHQAMRESRSEGVAQKSIRVGSLADATDKAKAWVERATNLLVVPSRSDQALATRVSAALAQAKLHLDRSIPTLVGLLREVAPHIDGDVASALADGELVKATLEAATGARTLAERAPVVDTAELDLADGKLYVRLRDLNAAGRAAVKHGHLPDAAKAEYRFTHFQSRSRKKAPPTA